MNTRWGAGPDGSPVIVFTQWTGATEVCASRQLWSLTCYDVLGHHQSSRTMVA
jgi:hypothetical protein